MYKIISSVLLAFSLAANAQEPADDTRGVVEFDAKEIFGGGSSSFEIDLQGPLLNMMSSALRDHEPDLSELLENLKLIRVHIAPLAGRVKTDVKANIQNLIGKLEDSGWDRVMRVQDSQDDHEFVEAFMIVKDDIVKGFTLFVLGDEPDSNEAVFINIVGDIDPEKLGQIAGRYLPDEFDQSIFEDIAHGAKDEPESPFKAAQAALAAAREESTGASEGTLAAVKQLEEEANLLAKDGHEESAIRLLNTAASLLKN